MRGINVGICMWSEEEERSQSLNTFPLKYQGTVQVEMFTSQWKEQSETQQKGEAGVCVMNRIWEIHVLHLEELP